MHIVPILSTLRRHRLAAGLIVLEIAFTCAIVCNAIFLIGERLARIDEPSGAVEDELVRVGLTGIGKRGDADAVTQQALNALREIPGVKSVVPLNILPFGTSSDNTSVSTIADDPDPPVSAAFYFGGRSIVETMGLHLIAGRDFLPEEYVQAAAAL